MSGRFIPKPQDKPGLGDIAKVIHYKSDGRGRDTYISKTNGGLTFPNKPCDPRETFKKHLREYERKQNYVENRTYALATASNDRSVFGRLSLQMVSPRAHASQLRV